MKPFNKCTPKYQLEYAFKFLKTEGYSIAKTKQDLKKLWDSSLPHFGGHGPHRYHADTDFKDACVYCLRPKSWGQK